jgi:hypothetical protein
MSDPLVTSDELGTALNDKSINKTRAEFWIGQAQILCESVVSPLPATAAVVVTRVAARAYGSTASASRGPQVAAAGSPFTPGSGGAYLTKADRIDLRRLGGGGNAFTINLLPDDYTLTVPAWDQASPLDPTVETS